MRNQILLFSLLLTITSCTEYLLYYQTYTVESELEQNEGSLKYENEDCALYYNLWAEYGNPGFVMENKTVAIYRIDGQVVLYTQWCGL